MVSDVTLPDLKRMEFARVLAMDPEVVFLDEVMAGLNLLKWKNRWNW